jgi:hypothetical protein
MFSGRMNRPLLRAYVDETGDRGHTGGSSPFFAFAAVVVADEDEPGLRAAMSQLRRDFKVPAGKALHWKDHVKTYTRRQHASRVLAQVPGLVIIYVVVEKAAIPVGSGIYGDHVLFYNFAACLTMERLLLAARDWPAGTRDVIVRFGHVRGFDHSRTTRYFNLKCTTDAWIPWSRLHGVVHFDDQAKWDGLQAADQYAGMLNAAIRTDEFGGYEESHLLRIRHQLRRSSPGGKAWGYGFKVLGNTATFTSLPWWPSAGL